MQLMGLLDGIKDWLKTRRFYWAYRHIFVPNFWVEILKDALAVRRKFYAEYLHSISGQYVFEFGCSSGVNFHALQSQTQNFTGLGIDISKAAIQAARAHSPSETCHFDYMLSTKRLDKFLKGHQVGQFDLAIYDRVLYLMDNSEIITHFQTYGQYFKHLVVDDFHHDTGPQLHSGRYRTRDFISLLEKAGFVLVEKRRSSYPKSDTDEFFSKGAYILIFKQRAG